MTMGLTLTASSSIDMVAYSDVDWAGCPDTHRSMSGYCVYLGPSLISWSSKRQPIVSRSSAEAEYRAVANTVADCSWLRQLLQELLCVVPKATIVYCDNISAVYLSANPVHHRRTEHIQLDIHFIREQVALRKTSRGRSTLYLYMYIMHTINELSMHAIPSFQLTRSKDTLVRALPILIGGASLLDVLLNRVVSGIAAVSDASSSQSRANILTLALFVTDILAGLVWLSIRPKTISSVAPRGVDCKRVDEDVSSSALRELLWTWDSPMVATCCKSLVVVYGGNCKLQIGVAAASPEDGNVVDVDAQKFMQGSLYKSAMESKKQSYLANLALYPGRTELPFLPNNTQALILQPIGDKGIAVIGGDTTRAFTNLDQAWIAMIADKLDATLSKP
ncbi:protein COFACTOR ASSEMBLY OF COMPLEX C SUBUNIT B CCB4, chloroplastic-like [Triticum aestivum]|uniref:protein COFACTOR ASSEMBLY OF COMPLEX C SUBUNIT B CCB4, chloroplastic-like n=1 Tax=Triticum aestivum TaxID=4565 RepID=UPI001D0058F8|nr:protein COFACTOR ASSEMBLY OF COMPLEX C SUBUNIT B CCB4, chloroplastic-like [Triticum aestivum]